MNIASALRPDMILLSTELAEADNNLLCQELKENPRTAGIPLAIMAAQNPYPKDNPWGISLHLEKSLSGATLLNRINQLVD